MSERARLDKQANRLRKALRNTPPRYFDLVQYVVDHHRIGYKRPTRKQAREMILAGKVQVDSHKIGREEIDLLGHKEWVLLPHIAVEHKSRVLISS
jgi:hypothetical protein